MGLTARSGRVCGAAVPGLHALPYDLALEARRRRRRALQRPFLFALRAAAWWALGAAAALWSGAKRRKKRWWDAHPVVSGLRREYRAGVEGLSLPGFMAWSLDP